LEDLLLLDIEMEMEMEERDTRYDEEPEYPQYTNAPQRETQEPQITQHMAELRPIPKIQVCKTMEMIRIHTQEEPPPQTYEPWPKIYYGTRYTQTQKSHSRDTPNCPITNAPFGIPIQIMEWIVETFNVTTEWTPTPDVRP
jgi:hypothetical protein